MTQEALKLALEFIERVNKDGWILADFEPQMYATITAIKEALRENAMREVQRLGQEIEQPKVRTGDCLLVGVCASEGHKIQAKQEPVKYSNYEPDGVHHNKPEQEPFFTEANGFPQKFVSKDRQKQAIISMTEQCAALVWERDELQKQVWLYEKNGVTCQTYRHKVEQSCSECNVQMNYTTPPQRTWVGLTDEEIAQGCKESWVTEQAWQSAVWWAEAKLKELNT